MNSEAKACRRCSECEGASHHWMEADVYDEGDPEYECKHCDTIGRECDGCCGDGIVEDDGSGAGECPCPMCQGEGVVVCVSDKERLDWLDETYGSSLSGLLAFDGAGSLRQAIDAARDRSVKGDRR